MTTPIGGHADELAELTARFERFADTSTRHSPLYAAISRRVAAAPDVAALLFEAEPEQRIPVLLLAAVHDLLLAGLDHPLAECYPTIVDEPTGSAGDAAERFVDLCRRHADRLAPILATHATQTNEVGRCAALRPVFTSLGDRHGAIGLVEVGASAGLNLWFDRYHLEYTGSTGVHEAGPPGSPVRLACGLVGDRVPPLSPEPVIASRVGLDRSPVDLTDPAQDRWLLACVWPDEIERFHRLQVAVAISREEPGTLVRGDAVDDISALVAAVPDAAHPVVFHSWVLSYLPEDRQRAFATELSRLGELRAVSHVWIESRDLVAGLPAPDEGPRRAGATEVVLIEHGGGPPTAVRLAEMHPHGRWIDWQAPEPTGQGVIAG